ncbi:hypothetical protein C8R43DRAFT_941230 [Mycena crocata]|nr:hypothetical protein C8R43DRAFT_941230 [Mycena crocata]
MAVTLSSSGLNLYFWRPLPLHLIPTKESLQRKRGTMSPVDPEFEDLFDKYFNLPDPSLHNDGGDSERPILAGDPSEGGSEPSRPLQSISELSPLPAQTSETSMPAQPILKDFGSVPGPSEPSHKRKRDEDEQISEHERGHSKRAKTQPRPDFQEDFQEGSSRLPPESYDVENLHAPSTTGNFEVAIFESDLHGYQSTATEHQVLDEFYATVDTPQGHAQWCIVITTFKQPYGGITLAANVTEGYPKIWSSIGGFFGSYYHSRSKSRALRPRKSAEGGCGGKRFPCDHCAQTYSRKDDVKRHMITVQIKENPAPVSGRSGSIGFKCKRCGKVFGRPHVLKRHELETKEDCLARLKRLVKRREEAELNRKQGPDRINGKKKK